MVQVLDASALISYLEKEPGYEKVKNLFIKVANEAETLLMSSVNWGEVFYILIKSYGLGKAEEIQAVIETFPVEFISADLILAKQAALYKATKKLSYADCFAAALAKIHEAELVTCDKDFRLLEKEINIIWV